MGTKSVIIVANLLLLSSMSFADSKTESEIRRVVFEINNNTILTKRTDPSVYSKLGALEFWSSGGLLQQVPPGGGDTAEFEIYTIVPKHIEVTTLVDGKAAIVHYYLEGSEQYIGDLAATNYLTRCTQAFVKEDGEWKIRSSHWSRIVGGVGTTRTAVP